MTEGGGAISRGCVPQVPQKCPLFHHWKLARTQLADLALHAFADLRMQVSSRSPSVLLVSPEDMRFFAERIGRGERDFSWIASMTAGNVLNNVLAWEILKSVMIADAYDQPHVGPHLHAHQVIGARARHIG